MEMHPRIAAHSSRRGAVVVLAAFLLVVVFGVLAFVVDIGYLQSTKTELQRSADAAALAAAWELWDDGILNGTLDTTGMISTARTKAAQFAAANNVCGSAPGVVNTNTGDVVIGYMSNFSDPSGTINTSPSLQSQANAVQVRVQKSTAMNGNSPFFFAKIFGMNNISTSAQATAAVVNNVSGFKTPGGNTGGNVMILPFALDKQTWDNLLAGGGSDNYSCTPPSSGGGCGGGGCGGGGYGGGGCHSGSSCGTVHNVCGGHDGVCEVNLYPQGTGCPGNRGTVNIGPCNNSTCHLSSQILNGVTSDDLSYHGGQLKLNSSGKLYLNGDTGISAGVKDELASIIGQTRIIPIFNTVTGPGNNATYEIVAFAGVRILDVQLTGSMSSKKLMVQPAKVVATGGIPGTGTASSYYVVSPAWLIR